MKDELKWLPVIGYEELYEVSNYGQVRNTRTGKILSGVNTNGYIRVRLYNKDGKPNKYYVHRLVAEAFILNPNNYPIVNHKDENKSNNYYENLEWCTYLYNLTYNNMHITRGIKQRNVQQHYVSEETKQKIIESNRTRIVTEEQKRKTSESLKKYYASKREFDELEKLGYIRGVTYIKDK